MKTIAILGFSPREEVIIRRIREQDPATTIHLFLLGQNPVLARLADRIFQVDLNRIETTVVDPIRSLSPDIVLIGPPTFSTAGVADALTAAGVASIGADQEQIRIETSKAFLRDAVPELGRFYPPHVIVKENVERATRAFIATHPECVL